MMNATRTAAFVLAVGLCWGIPQADAASGTSVSGGRLYVVNTTAGSVSVLDATTGARVVPDIPVGNGPRGCALSTDGTRFYVANRDDDTVSVISTATNLVHATIPVTGMGPEHMTISPDGSTLYLTHQISSNVSVVSTASLSETSLISLSSPSGSPRGLAVSPDGAKLYVVDRGASVVDVFSTSTLIPAAAPIPVPSGPRDVRFSADGSKAIVVGDGPPVIVDPTTDLPTATIFADIGQQRDVAVVGSIAYVANFQNTALSSGAVDVYDLVGEALVNSHAVAGRRPSALAVDPQAACAFTVIQDDDQMRVLDLGTGLESGVVGPTGVSPRCIAILPASQVRSAARLVPVRARLDRDAAGPGVDRLSLVADVDGKSEEGAVEDEFLVDVGDVTHDVGGLEVVGRRGNRFRGAGSGAEVDLRWTGAAGERGRLRLVAEGAFAGRIDADGFLAVAVRSGGFEASTRVELDDTGRFGLAGKAGDLVAASLEVVSLSARQDTGKGAKLAFRAVFPSQDDPGVVPDVVVTFGDLEIVLAGTEFRSRGKKGLRAKFGGGVLDLDLVRGTISVRAKPASLGIAPEDTLAAVGLELGDARFDGAVGLRRKGSKILY